MLKNKFSFLFFLFFILNTAQASCYSAFKSLFQLGSGLKETEAISFTESITKIEKFTNFLRKGKKDPTPALNLKIAKKLNIFHENLFADNFAANERQWRVFFRVMETKLIAFKRYKSVIEYLDSHPSANRNKFHSELKKMDFGDEFNQFIGEQLKEFRDLDQFKIKLQEEINSTLVDIGNDYQEYRMVRGNLEDLLKSEECKDICRKQATMLLEGLGVNSEKESLAHPTFFKDQLRPSISELRVLLYQEPLFVLTKAKRERNQELKSFFISFLSQPQFVDSILGLIYKSDSLGKTKAVQLFKFIYDSHAQNVYFPKLNKILFGAATAKENTAILKGLASTADQDELLITFARRADTLAQEKWKAIKSYSQEFEKDFAKKLDDAEKKATARGEISPTRNKALLTKIALIAGTGTGLYTYFYFDAVPTSIEIEAVGDAKDEQGLSQANPSELAGIEDSQLEPVTLDEDQKILLGGELDQMLDEVSEVMMIEQVERQPTSLKKNK